MALEDSVVDPTHTEVGGNRMLPLSSDACKDLMVRRVSMKRELARIGNVLDTDMP